MENIVEKLSEELSVMKNKAAEAAEEKEFWMAITFFLIGVIIGIILSPRKTKNVGCNCDYSSVYDNRCDDGYCGEDCCDCE